MSSSGSKAPWWREMALSTLVGYIAAAVVLGVLHFLSSLDWNTLRFVVVGFVLSIAVYIIYNLEKRGYFVFLDWS